MKFITSKTGLSRIAIAVLAAAGSAAFMAQAAVTKEGDITTTPDGSSGSLKLNIGPGITAGQIVVDGGSQYSVDDYPQRISQINIGTPGTLRIDGAGSELNFSGVLSQAPDGQLIIQNGAQANLNPGPYTSLNLQGITTVSGAGSYLNANLTNFGGSMSGYAPASLSILDGAQVDFDSITTSNLYLRKGTIAVSGRGSILNMTASYFLLPARVIFSDGIALNVTEGGAASIDTDIYLQENAVFSVAGRDSQLSARAIDAADSGLQVANGGTFLIDGDLTMTNSAIAASGAGSRLDVTGNAALSRQRLTLSDEAQIAFNGGFTASDSVFSLDNAQLTLTDATLDNTTLRVARSAVITANSIDATGGGVTVNGAGSAMNVDDDLRADGSQVYVTSGGALRAGNILLLDSDLYAGGNGTQIVASDLLDNTRQAEIVDEATVTAGRLNNSGTLRVDRSNTTLDVSNLFTNTGIAQFTNGAALNTEAISNSGGLLGDGRGTALNVNGNFTNTGNAQFANGAAASAQTLINSGTGLFLNGTGTLLNVIGRLTNSSRFQIINSATATLGSLSNDAGGVLVSGAGAALNADTIASSGTILVSDGGSLNASDITLTASSTATPSTLNIGNVSGSSAGGAGSVSANVITLNSAPGSRTSVNFNHTSSAYNFTPVIAGDGDVSQASGVTTLTGANTYSGTTRITGGTLRAGAGNAFSANSVYDITDGGTLDLNGYSQTTGNLTNAGTVNLAGSRAGAVLTVAGNYAGNNGLLSFGTELGDDRSRSDRLVVTGDITGNTRVRVRNLGGSGAATLNGIELIEVQGSADSSAFTQQGRIVAGAYDYRIYRADKNWYLSNRENLEGALPIIPGDGSENPGGGGENPGGGGENPGNGGGNGGGGGEMVLRPEGGAYAANLSTAATLFDTRMSDRQGTYYLDPLTGEEKHTSLWLRMSGDHNRVNGGSDQLRTRANSFVTMLGGDVAATDNARLGLLAGYGNSKSNAESRLTGYRAKGQINGYTTGLYGTWFAEGTDEKGLWTDSTLQYSWFNNSVDGEDEPGEAYKSKGLSASLSAGYVIPLSAGERTAFFLQPQARVGWSGIKADDHRERNGTLVQGSGQDNVSSSLGVKAFMKGHAATDDNSGRQFGMFTEANWIHNTREYAVRMDDVAVSQSGSRNIAEVRVGLDGALGGGFGIKGTIGQQVGDNGWSDTAAALSVNYRF